MTCDDLIEIGDKQIDFIKRQIADSKDGPVRVNAEGESKRLRTENTMKKP